MMEKSARPDSVDLDNEEHEVASKPLLGKYLPLSNPSLQGTPYAKSQKLHYLLCVMHVVLLSTSLTLFALAHCMRYRRPSDLYHTLHYSSYCEFLNNDKAWD
jgi:hypothetical protein